MNFFQEQERARRHTLQLVLLFIASVAILIGVTILFVAGLYLVLDGAPIMAFVQNPLYYIDAEALYGVSIVIFIVVGGGTLYKYLTLSSGGKSVAIALGGKQLNHNSADLKEKVLLNVVDEMSIASGISTPTVYILDESSINAFAAGLTVDDAVIGITRGAIEKLSRDELQGVIAHEFSHIFNGDMRLNIQLTATLHGILLIGMVGYFILRHFSGSSSSRSSSSSKKGNGGNYVLFLGLGLMAIGYAGTFFGSLIKAGVSRKREFLADATAVQYTRYPLGISGALKKISYYSSAINSSTAETYSHLYFSSGVSHFFSILMATHPPLAERIGKVEPHWNGHIPDYEKLKQPKPTKIERNSQEKRDSFAQSIIAATMLRVGTIKEEEVEETHVDIEMLDVKVLERLNDPLGAQAAILALFYDAEHKEELFAIVKEHSPYLLLELVNLLREGYGEFKSQGGLIASRSLNALKSLSIPQFKSFITIVEVFVTVDGHTSLFEWSLQYIIQRPIEMHLGLRKVPKTKHTHLGAVKAETEYLFSMLAQSQYDDEEVAQKIFAKVTRIIHSGALQYQPKTTINHDVFMRSVQALETVRPGVAERIFEGVLHIIKADDGISDGENAFVHAIAQLLQVPLPREFRLEGGI